MAWVTSMLEDKIDECKTLLDAKFGEGFASLHPELVLQLLLVYRITEIGDEISTALTGENTDRSLWERLTTIIRQLEDIQVVVKLP